MLNELMQSNGGIVTKAGTLMTLLIVVSLGLKLHMHHGGKTWSYDECTRVCFKHCNVFNTNECILHKTRSYEE